MTGDASEAAGAESRRILVIACGALAKEILAVIDQAGLKHLQLACLPAIWHNTPQKIPEAVREKIREARGSFERVLVAYGDCGTGGRLDRVLAEEGAERIAGPHCYAFYRGVSDFLAEADEDPTCFYLTDYLVRHFDRLIIDGLGLDRHPELRADYFGNYTKLVYLRQTVDPALEAQARRAAARLGLAYESRLTGYGGLDRFLRQGASGDGGADHPQVA